jgi:hypothetical protein
MAGEGRKVKYPAKRAERALKTLEQDGLIEIRGMLDTRPAGYYSKVGGKVKWHSLPGIEWKSRPEFRITNPALRGKLIRTRLGDLELPKRAA